MKADQFTHNFWSPNFWWAISEGVIYAHAEVTIGDQFNVKMIWRKFSRLRQSFIKISRNIEVFCKAQSSLFDSYLCSFKQYIFINIYIYIYIYIYVYIYLYIYNIFFLCRKLNKVEWKILVNWVNWLYFLVSCV